MKSRFAGLRSTDQTLFAAKSMWYRLSTRKWNKTLQEFTEIIQMQTSANSDFQTSGQVDLVDTVCALGMATLIGHVANGNKSCQKL